MVHRPLEGKLIRLRAREPEDEPLLFEWFNDPEVTDFLLARYPFSHQQKKESIERYSVVGYTSAGFAVETLADRRLIGTCSLHANHPEDRRAELGIALGDKACWDGGYGTDTMLTVCRFGFEEMNFHRIELWVYAENARARHVYEKIGFKEEGNRREAIYQGGRYRAEILMGLLEGELRGG